MALKFSKDLPAENLSDRLISKFVKKLEQLKVNQLREQMRAKIAETKRKAEIAKLKLKGVLLESDEVLEKARKKAEKKAECSARNDAQDFYLLRAVTDKHFEEIMRRNLGNIEKETRVQANQEVELEVNEMDNREREAKLLYEQQNEEVSIPSELTMVLVPSAEEKPENPKVTPPTSKSAKISRAQQILKKVLSPKIVKKKKHFPSGNDAMDKIHKELKKTKETAEKGSSSN